MTPFGYMFIPILLFAIVMGRKWLFRLTVFSVGLFGVSVANLSVTELRPFELAGVILILAWGFGLPAKARRSGRISRPAFWLLLFLVSVVVSTAMPLVLKGGVQVVSINTAYTDYYRTQPLTFSWTNITQLMYVVFMVAFCMALSSMMRQHRYLETTVRVLAASGTVVAVSGFIFQVGILLGRVGALTFLFHAFGGPSALPYQWSHYDFSASGGVPRIYSLAGEPGYTSSFLLAVLGLHLAAFLGRPDLLGGTRRARFRGFLIVAAMLLSGSTTAYLGLAVLFGVTVIVWFSSHPESGRSNRRRYVKFLGVSAAAMAAIFMTWGVFGVGHFDVARYIYNTHVEKLFGEGGGSGPIRLEAVKYSLLHVFPKSPWLGVGWGAHRTAVLLISLLTNLGIVGTTAFFAFNWSALRALKRRVGRAADDLDALRLATLSALATLLVVMLIAKSAVAMIQGWYWVLVAMAIALGRSREMASSQQVERKGMSNLSREVA